jgi:hypothetical protein
LESASNPTK